MTTNGVDARWEAALKRLLSHLTICYGLLAVAALALAEHNRRTAGVCLLLVFGGGVGAAWGRWTALGDDWLQFGGVRAWPDRLTLGCLAIHLPALPAALWLLRKKR